MPSSWFQERLGSWVLRMDTPDSDFRSYKLSENPKAVLYYHEIQNAGVKFKPMLTIHKAQQEECLACSG